MSLITFRPADSNVCNNNSTTGASVSSDCACSAALVAARQLRASIDAVANGAGTGADEDWLTKVRSAADAGLDLTARRT